MKKLSLFMLILSIILGILMLAVNTGELIVQVLIAMAPEFVTKVTDTLCRGIDCNTYPANLNICS